jgi:hypothetical protein
MFIPLLGLGSAFVSGALIARLVFRGEGWNVRWLAALVFAGMFVVLPFQALGLLEIAGLVPSFRIEILVGAELAILATALLVYRARRRDAANPKRGDSPLAGAPKWFWVAGAIVALTYLVAQIELLAAFPRDADGCHYHYPLVLRWIQKQNILIDQQTAWQFAMPSNGEIGMYFFVPTGWDGILPLAQWPALVMLSLAIWFFTRDLLGFGQAGFLALLIVLCVPMVHFQTFSGYVEMYGTACILTACTLLVRWWQAGSESRPRDLSLLFVSAAAMGLAAGAKPIYWLYAIAYGAVCFWLIFGRTDWRLSRRIYALVLAGGGVALSSVFWIIRATVLTGNPVYPMQVMIGDRIVFSGVAPSDITALDYGLEFVRKPLEWWVYPWVEYKRNAGYLLDVYNADSGLGPLYATFVPLGLCFLIWKVSRDPELRKKIQPWIAGMVVSLLAWATVFHEMPRFVLPAILLTVLLATPLLEFLLANRPRFLAVLFLGVLLAGSGRLLFRPAYHTASRLRDGDWSRAAYYGYPNLLDKLPPGSRLLNTGYGGNNLALAGAGFRNFVLAEFESPETVTSDFLRQHRIDYVVRQENIPEDASPDAIAPPVQGLELFGEARGHSSVDGMVEQWRLWKFVSD